MCEGSKDLPILQFSQKEDVFLAINETMEVQMGHFGKLKDFIAFGYF
jgi:hypothetical protein